MLQGVEGDASGPKGSVVAELVGDEAVRRLVKGHGEDHRYHPGARLIQRRAPVADGVHAWAAPVLAVCPSNSAKRASAVGRSNFRRDATRSASPRAMRVCACGDNGGGPPPPPPPSAPKPGPGQGRAQTPPRARPGRPPK